MAADDDLTVTLLNSFNQYKQQLVGKRVWLACSGGRDSLSLAHLCQQLFNNSQLPFLPQLLHVNHGMQQANSAWAEKVLSWAKQNNMPCELLNIVLSQKTEQEARRLRYQAMISVMNQDDVLILGHHQDDQVETLLMRLFNGAGVNGLSGMQQWSVKYDASEQAIEDRGAYCIDNLNDYPNHKHNYGKKIYLWRPFLTVSRQQITTYAHSQQLPYIDDPTNIASPTTETKILETELNDRAWLRSVLLPSITERYPKAKPAMARTSQLMQDANLIISEQSAADLSKLSITNVWWGSVIDVSRLTDLSAARQSAAIHSWLAPTATELPPSKRLVEEVLALGDRKDSNHQTSLFWNNGYNQYHIRRYQNKLYRLADNFEKWLQLEPQTQSFSLHQLANKDRVHLKPEASEFKWQLKGAAELADVLKAHWLMTAIDEKDNNNINDNDLYDIEQFANNQAAKGSVGIVFQPLPRDLKLALAGRIGRKSGKKLLQAIDQPSFMRQSVVLCSLCFEQSATTLPILLIALDKILVLESGLKQQMIALIDNSKLTTQLSSLQ